MDYEAPECKFDFPAMLRDSIVTEVRCQGQAERCSQQMSAAFADFDTEQIDQWCDDNDLVIIARLDRRIEIRRAAGSTIQEFVESRISEHNTRIRAEVEAMDWPEVIGE